MFDYIKIKKLFLLFSVEVNNIGISIAFVSVKGGVGKTTLAIETASALANVFKKKVLLIDANFSAPNIGLYLGIKKDFTLHNVLNDEEGLHAAIYEAFGMDVVPASMYFNDAIDLYRLKKVLDKHRHRYDFIIIDSSPHYSEMAPAVMAADRVFVVTTPDKVTLQTSIKAAKIAKENNVPVDGIIINKIKDSKYEEDLASVEEVSGLSVIAKIKNHEKILEAGFNNTPITIYDGFNHISKEVKKFAGALAGESEQESFFDKVFRWRHWGKEKVNRELMRKSFYESQIK